MSQRGIGDKLLNMTLQFGVEDKSGKVILNRQGLEELVCQLRELQQAAERAAAKGGLVVVRDGDVLVTTYHLDTYRRGRGATVSPQERA